MPCLSTQAWMHSTYPSTQQWREPPHPVTRVKQISVYIMAILFLSGPCALQGWNSKLVKTFVFRHCSINNSVFSTWLKIISRLMCSWSPINIMQNNGACTWWPMYEILKLSLTGSFTFQNPRYPPLVFPGKGRHSTPTLVSCSI